MDLKWRYKGFFHTMMMEQDAILKNTTKKETCNHDMKSSCEYDAVILYNSGLGHANQFENWKPTLEYLLQLQQQLPPQPVESPKFSKQQQQRPEQRRRPVIWLTAHSHLDAQRDAQVLQEYYKVENVKYQRNPFASRVTYQDPLLVPTTLQKNNSNDDSGGYVDDLSLIRPNEYIAMIP